MQRVTRTILWLCILSVTGVMILQLSWLRNYYLVNKDRFEKDVNLAFEDAIKKEAMVRCDTLENRLYRFLMDSTQMDILSKWSPRQNRYTYIIANRYDTTDRYQFSIKQVNLPITSEQPSVKAAVARHFARTYREEDLERHVIYFNTQNIGNYISDQSAAFNFDTTRLSHYLTHYLHQRAIHEPFHYYLSDADSMLNASIFPDSLQQRYPVITKAFPTYLVEKDRNYVRAMFPAPTNYLFHKMSWMLAATILFIAIVAYALYYLLRIIQREKKLSAIKNDFISNVTHELQTPITTVSGALEAMQDFEVLNDRAKTLRYINISRNEINRLAGMVNKILSLSVYERNDFTLRASLVNIDSLLQTLIASYAVLKEKAVHFAYRNELSDPLVKADELHLYNALTNLVDNAIKYSGPEVIIGIHCRRENGFLLIEVKDNGLGISPAHQELIFNRFYRVPAAGSQVKGHGLGLSYVKSIIGKHGGWCAVESEVNKGSTFKLAIPHE